jgi:DNA-binding NarL/FixJ family response regulator
VLLNRADILLSSHGKEAADIKEDPISLNSQPAEIIGLAKEGHGVEEIANMLSIPKGEVKLVLDLKEKFSRMGSKEGVS